MRIKRRARSAVRLLSVGAGVAVAGYAAYAVGAWRRYGYPPVGSAEEHDELLDQFMPAYDVVERHRIRVAAPADVAFAAAKNQDLLHLPLVRAIFRAREIVLRSTPDHRDQPRRLLDAARALGWGVLAEVPGREIVVGAVARPWEANVRFAALPPDEFAEYWEPGFVKIAWTLRADPVGPNQSVFLTETRAVATDPLAWSRFRQYWALASLGVASLRWLSLRPLRREAERRAHDRPPSARRPLRRPVMIRSVQT